MPLIMSNIVSNWNNCLWVFGFQFINSGTSEHGTLMAGLAAAEANNARCGVGAAFNAQISGILSQMSSLDIVRFLRRSFANKSKMKKWQWFLVINQGLSALHFHLLVSWYGHYICQVKSESEVLQYANVWSGMSAGLHVEKDICVCSFSFNLLSFFIHIFSFFFLSHSIICIHLLTFPHYSHIFCSTLHFTQPVVIIISKKLTAYITITSTDIALALTFSWISHQAYCQNLSVGIIMKQQQGHLATGMTSMIFTLVHGVLFHFFKIT